MFRIDSLEEEVGLDISHHRGPCYDLSEPKQEHVEELKLRHSMHGDSSNRGDHSNRGAKGETTERNKDSSGASDDAAIEDEVAA